MNRSQTEESLLLIRKALDEVVEDPHLTVDKLRQLINLLGTAAEAKSSAHGLYLDAYHKALSMQYTKEPTMIRKELAQGIARNEYILLQLSERYEKALVHAIEAYRSVVSFYKTDMSITRFNQS